MKKQVILLLSGGLDSVVLLYHLISENCSVHALLIDYGQRHAQELNFAKGHCHRLNVMFTVIKLPQLRGSELTDGSGSVVVPGRNAIFISHAVNLAVSAGAEAVVIGCNAADEAGFPDCRKAFIDAYNAMLKAAEIKVEICAPFLNVTKWQIASLGQEMGVALYDTWSCYRGGAKPCGECPACQKRTEAGA